MQSRQFIESDTASDDRWEDIKREGREMRMVQSLWKKQLCRPLTPRAPSLGCRTAGQAARFPYQEESLCNLGCQQAIGLSCERAAYCEFVLAHLQGCSIGGLEAFGDTRKGHLWG